MIWRER